MTVVKVTPPAGYPVTLAETKAHLRVTNTAHDDIITAYIAAATAYIETITEMALVEQVIRIELDGFPEGDIDIPVAPVQSVTSIKYDDTLLAEQTLVESTHYFVRVSGRYPIIAPKGPWPTAYSGKPGSVRITLLAGYPTNDSPLNYGERVPADLRHAILINVKERFDHGGETIVQSGQVSPSANTVDALTKHYRRYYAL